MGKHVNTPFSNLISGTLVIIMIAAAIFLIASFGK